MKFHRTYDVKSQYSTIHEQGTAEFLMQDFQWAFENSVWCHIEVFWYILRATRNGWLFCASSSKNWPCVGFAVTFQRIIMPSVFHGHSDCTSLSFNSSIWVWQPMQWETECETDVTWNDDTANATSLQFNANYKILLLGAETTSDWPVVTFSIFNTKKSHTKSHEASFIFLDGHLPFMELPSHRNCACAWHQYQNSFQSCNDHFLIVGCNKAKGHPKKECSLCWQNFGDTKEGIDLH